MARQRPGSGGSAPLFFDTLIIDDNGEFYKYSRTDKKDAPGMRAYFAVKYKEDPTSDLDADSKILSYEAFSSTYWIDCYQRLSGFITGIRIFENDNGDKLCIYLEDPEEGERYMIRCKMGRNFAESFLRRLPNIDYDLPVPISLYSWASYDEENNRLNHGIAVYQPGNAKSVDEEGNPIESGKLPSFYTADNPLPPLEKTKVGKKVVYDDSEKMKVLYALVDEYGNKRQAQSEVAEMATQVAAVVEEDEEDDLPF